MYVIKTCMSCEPTLNSDQWEFDYGFSNNLQRILVTMTTLWDQSNTKEVYLPWQNTYPKTTTTCNIRVKRFLSKMPRELTPRQISHICRCRFKKIYK